MTPVLRRAMPVLFAALALAHTGCGSKYEKSTPTGPQPPASGAEGRLTAMAVAPPLGAADPFGVLAASAVANTGATVITGELGISPNDVTSITGFPPGTSGTVHAADAVALAAQNSIVTAYNALAIQACDLVLTGTDLGGLTLTPGTYCFSTSAQLTGTLTLNALGDPGAVWVFQIGSTLTTASGSSVVFINGGQSCGAFWQVGSSATLGSTTDFAGNILALASITLNTNANNSGGLFARTGAVTLDDNNVSRVGSCGSGGPVPALPHGMEWGLLVLLVGIGAYILSRR